MDRSAGRRRSSPPAWRSPRWWAGSCSRTTGPPRGAARPPSRARGARSSSGRRSSATPSTPPRAPLHAAGDSPRWPPSWRAADLGMSEEYGLALSRAPTRDRLARASPATGSSAPSPPSPASRSSTVGERGGRRGPDGRRAPGIDLAPRVGGGGRHPAPPDGAQSGLGARGRAGREARRPSWWAGSTPERRTRALVQEFRSGARRPPHSYLVDARASPSGTPGLRHGAPLPQDIQAIPADGRASSSRTRAVQGRARSWPASGPGRTLFLVDVHPYDDLLPGRPVRGRRPRTWRRPWRWSSAPWCWAWC